MNIYVIPIIPAPIEAHMTQQKLKQQGIALPGIYENTSPASSYRSDSSTLRSLILTLAQRVNYNNALCSHYIVKPCLSQWRTFCVNMFYILMVVVYLQWPLMPVACILYHGKQLNKLCVSVLPSLQTFFECVSLCVNVMLFGKWYTCTGNM